MERFIGKTFVEHQSNFIENSQDGKQIGKILDMKNRQKRPQAQKPIFLGLESEKSENMVPNFENFEKYEKDAHKKSLENGSYTFSNELVRFRNEAKPIWGNIQKHCKNAVIN